MRNTCEHEDCQISPASPAVRFVMASGVLVLQGASWLKRATVKDEISK